MVCGTFWRLTSNQMIPICLQPDHIPSGSLHSAYLPVCLLPSFPCDVLIPILVSIAILICLENSFWNQDTGGNFVDSFKKSFALYVGSGIRKTTEADIDVLRNEQGARPVTGTFKAKLRKIIMDHYLRKLHGLYSHSTFLTTFFV